MMKLSLSICLSLVYILSPLVYSSESFPLEGYDIFAGFKGDNVHRLNVQDKTYHILLRYEYGQAFFDYVNYNMFQPFPGGMLAKGYISRYDNPSLSNLTALFDENGIFIRTIRVAPQIGGVTTEKFSYTGNYLFLDAIPGIAIYNLKTLEKAQVITEESITNLQPLRDDKGVVYQTEDYKIKRYDMATGEIRVILEADEPMWLSDVSYDNKKLLCTDERRILILDLDTEELQVVKEYKPGLFTFRNRISRSSKHTRPRILTGKFSWREDGKGFIFCRFNWRSNFLWLTLDPHLKEPDLYYYHLETGKETLLWRKTGINNIALRKNLIDPNINSK